MRLAVFLLLSALSVAAAAADADWGLVQQAQQAEHEGDPAHAETLYSDVLTRQRGTPVGRVAESRLAWLRERNVDGYRPLTLFLKARTAAEHDANPQALDAFEHAVDAFPPGLVRRESRAFIADTAARLEGQPAAERRYHAWLAEPGLDAAAKESATLGLATVEVQMGHPRDALRILREAGLAGRPIYRQVLALAIQHIGVPIAIMLLVLFGVFAAAAVLPRLSLDVLRRAFSTGNVLAALLVTVVPALIAVRYTSSLAYMTERIGLSLAAILSVSFVAGEAIRARPASRGLPTALACLAVLACVSAGFLGIARSEMVEDLLRWRGLQ